MSTKDAVIAVLFDQQWQILLAHSKTNKDDWGFPGGKVEPYETLEEAMKRELFEETGYVCEMIPFYIGMDGNYKVTVFTNSPNHYPHFVTSNNEQLGKWGSLDEVLNPNPNHTHFDFNLKLITTTFSVGINSCGEANQ